MMTSLSTSVKLSSRIDQRAGEFVEWLIGLASIPSISATGEGIRECASHLILLLKSLGVDARIIETNGHPIVWGQVGTGSPRLLVYGHYDVQPAGPEDQWQSPPFTPTIRGNAVYGRGVGDNKGQLLAHVCALSAWLDVYQSPPPFSIVFVFDGEEEIGSPNTMQLIARHPEYFGGDCLILADGSTLGIWNPAIFLTNRGLVYLEFHVDGPDKEWHSGSYGGLLPNPVVRLAEALQCLVGSSGLVRVPGFHDDIKEPTETERRLAAKVPSSFLSDPHEFGCEFFLSDSPRERMFFQPQFCVCGFSGGYGGTGVKTAVPTSATAKVDITIVPNQHPDRIVQSIRSHLDAKGFDYVGIETLAACPPVSTSFNNHFVQTIIKALANVWDKEPVVFPSIGGGGPLSAFAGAYGMPCLLVPYAQADLHEHSADEHLSLAWFINGVKTSAEFFRLIAES
jgi:acetylornithine deacetylase/succinyl-diaminopimelate desuccinylase-like protein